MGTDGHDRRTDRPPRLGPGEGLLVRVGMEQHPGRCNRAVLLDDLPSIGMGPPPGAIGADRHRDRVVARHPCDLGADHIGAARRLRAISGSCRDGEHQPDRGETAYRSTMTEFTVHLPNRPGSLADLAERLAGVGINIEALAAIGIDATGTVRLIVDDEAATRRVLEHHGIRFEERRVITTMLPDRPGSVASMTRQLADAGMNIDAMYLLRSTPEGLEFAIAFDEEADQLAS